MSKSDAIIEAVHKIEDLELPPEVELCYQKMKPNVSTDWLARVRSKLRADPAFKNMFEIKKVKVTGA